MTFQSSSRASEGLAVSRFPIYTIGGRRMQKALVLSPHLVRITQITCRWDRRLAFPLEMLPHERGLWQLSGYFTSKRNCWTLNVAASGKYIRRVLDVICLAERQLTNPEFGASSLLTFIIGSRRCPPQILGTVNKLDVTFPISIGPYFPTQWSSC